MEEERISRVERRRSVLFIRISPITYLSFPRKWESSVVKDLDYPIKSGNDNTLIILAVWAFFVFLLPALSQRESCRDREQAGISIFEFPIIVKFIA